MPKIILFDGVCNLCNWSVQFIIKRDKKAAFKFASIQSKVGQLLLKQKNINSQECDSIVYIKDERYFLRSSAVLEILKDIGGKWKLFYGFIAIPRFIRDSIYNLIAKSRYKLFGKRSECAVPSEALKNRFLE
jgi:predicted DCC family thiol-disulfide oxidoreductase YuxK